MRFLVMLIGAVAVAMGVLGIAAPRVLLAFGESIETPAALFVVGALRVFFGLVLLRAAAISRTPVTFRVLGVFLMIVGVMTPLFGVERSRAVAHWWATDGFVFFRPAVGLAVLFGLFLVFAVAPPGRAVRR